MSEITEHAYWQGKPDPRTRPHYCARQARRTPVIPWHNGYPTCVACGRDVRSSVRWPSDSGSSSVILLAGLLPILLAVVFLARLAGTVSGALS